MICHINQTDNCLDVKAAERAADKRAPDSQAWPLRDDAEIKGCSAAESEHSEEVASFAVRRRGAPAGREGLSAAR
jgi:hypothetical protein